MKTITITILSISLFATELFAAGSAITPPSTGGRGLVRRNTASSFNQGNLGMTGNVTGGRQFRGFVPYSSSTQFQGTLGSRSLDSFRSAAAGSNPFSNTSPGQSNAYYSSTGSVTTMQNGKVYGSRTSLDLRLNGIVKSPTMGTSGHSARTVSAPLSQKYSAPLSQISTRPLTRDSQNVLNGFKQDLYNIAVGKDIKKDKITDKKTSSKEDAQRLDDKILEEGIFEPLKPEKILSPENINKSELKFEAKDSAREDIFEQIQKADNIKDSDEDQETSEDAQDEEASDSVEKKAASSANQATGIRGKHKTFASYTNDKFNNYMQLAENYIKEGKYYKAADSFSLASIFKKGDPLPFAGQSLALLGAGEYMSSSFYLHKAILTYNKFPEINVDLVAMIGDKDILDSRIIEIQEWQKRSESAELATLLSYIHMQMDQLDWAKTQIEKAQSIDGDSMIITSLKTALEKKTSSQ